MHGSYLQQAPESVGKGQNGQSKAAGSSAREWERRRTERVSGCDMGQRVRSSVLCGFVVIEFISWEASLAHREASRKWTLQGP